MPEQNDTRLTPEQAYERLIYELYENGPFRLVEYKGHPDLINSKVRLCCAKQGFLDVIDFMQRNELIQALENEHAERIYTLTYKGYLTALLMRYRTRREKRCTCNKCAVELAAVFEGLLCELQRDGPMQLTVSSHRRHPHFMSRNSQLCCRQAPFLEAMCALERHNLVRMTGDFVFQLTAKGAMSALLLQAPNSRVRSERAMAN